MKTIREIFDEAGVHKWFDEEITDKNATYNNLPIDKMEKNVISHNEYDYLTVRQLIKLLLDVENLDDEVFIKDKDGNRLHQVSICSKEGSRLGALFG